MPSSTQSLAAQFLTMLERQRDYLLQTEGWYRYHVDRFYPEKGDELGTVISSLDDQVAKGATGVPVIEGHEISPGHSRHIRLVFLGTTDEGTLEYLRSRSAQHLSQRENEAPPAVNGEQLINTTSRITEHTQAGGDDYSIGESTLVSQDGAHATNCGF